jgi:non-ribosomal peptide synthetase component F
MLGMFVNTLVMRGAPKKEKTLLQFIEEVKNFCLQAYEQQEYPFEALVEDLNLPRDMSREPLFDVMFSLDTDMAPEQMSIDGIQFETIDKEDIDLVVMGSSGKSGFDRFIMGSVAEKVVNAAECSVLVVY